MVSFHFFATSLLSLCSIAVAARPTSNNDSPPTLVNLRVEGAASTIFEGPVYTSGKSNITTAAGGSHHCDGTNNHANPTPGATCTSALVDAHVPFDGTYDAQFDDFFIMKIGQDVQTATQFWGVLRNWQFTPVGGCQQEVTSTDNILWAYDAFNKQGFLRMTVQAGQRSSTQVDGTIGVGKTVTLVVTNGSTGNPVAGASILNWNQNGSGTATILGTTDANGAVVITSTVFKNHKLFNTARLKADKTGYLRSNSVRVAVLGKL